MTAPPLHSRTITNNESEEIAAFIKQEFDMKYNPTWNSFVGSDMDFAMPMLNSRLCSVLGGELLGHGDHLL